MSTQTVYTEKGVCSHCAINLCKDCLNNNKYCHGNDNGRTICSKHSKNNRVVSIDSNRVLIATEALKSLYHSLYTHYVSLSKNNKEGRFFNTFYSEYNNTAHYYEIFDRSDTELWRCILLSIIFLILFSRITCYGYIFIC